MSFKKAFPLILWALAIMLNCSDNENSLNDNSNIKKDTFALEFEHLNKIEIENEIGNFEIYGTDESDEWTCVVSTVAENKSGDNLDELIKHAKIEAIDHPNSMYIKSYSDKELSSKEQISFHYLIKAPKEIAYKIKNEIGEIMISDVHDGINISNDNGSIRLYDIKNDFLQIQTIVGHITVEAAPSVDEIMWDFRTTTGSIDLTIKEQANALLTASTNNGSINWNTIRYFNVLEETSNLLKARIKEGKGEIFLETVNGNIIVTGY